MLRKVQVRASFFERINFFNRLLYSPRHKSRSSISGATRTFDRSFETLEGRVLLTSNGDLAKSDLVDYVQSLDYTEFRHLSASEIVHLTTDQVATIPDDWWFSRISSGARAALTEPHVQALDVADVGCVD